MVQQKERKAKVWIVVNMKGMCSAVSEARMWTFDYKSTKG